MSDCEKAGRPVQIPLGDVRRPFGSLWSEVRAVRAEKSPEWNVGQLPVKPGVMSVFWFETMGTRKRVMSDSKPFTRPDIKDLLVEIDRDERRGKGEWTMRV